MDEDGLQQLVGETFPALKALVMTSHRAPALVGRAETVLPLSRLAAWMPRDSWARPLDDWEGGDVDSVDDWRGALRSLVSHVLELYDVSPSLRLSLMHTDGTPCTEAGHRVALAFARVQAASGGGHASVLNTLKAEVSPATTKAIAKHFTQCDGITNPLHAFRLAQVRAFGPDHGDAVLEGVCAARLGASLGTGAEEVFAHSAIQWVCQHAGALQEASAVAHALDYFCEMYRTDDDFTVFGRTPKTVAAAIDAYEASTLHFDDDERFQANPRNIRPLFETAATIPAGTKLRVPYDPQVYELGGSGQLGADSATIRVAEILSLRRLVYEGQQLGNCLENKYRSQVKYISRARQRVSSFWSLTKQVDGEKTPQHLCLIEVWHLRSGNIIRQAEGPRPRTIPGPEAWYWLSTWCGREEVDLSTWDCYS